MVSLTPTKLDVELMTFVDVVLGMDDIAASD